MNRTLEQVLTDPISQALNPAGKQFMEARELPLELNPFAKYGIKIVALIPFSTFPHIKTVAAWQMMLEDFKNGLYKDKHTIVIDSSGNTAHAVARLARAFGFQKVKAVMSSDVPESKTAILRAFGDFVDVRHAAKPAETAREEGEKPGHYHLNQYGHMGNLRAHELYTGPEIVRSLGGDASKIAAVAIAMGSAGTVAGVGRFFKRAHPETTILGVRPVLGEQVPGARDEKKIKSVVTLPWEESVDCLQEVTRKESFARARQLWSSVEPQPGPTSGLAWGGLEHLMKGYSPVRLSALSGRYAAFICPDDGRFYSGPMLAELDPDQGTV